MRALRREGNPYPVGDPRYTPTLDEELALGQGRHAGHGAQFPRASSTARATRNWPSSATSTPRRCAHWSPNSSATGRARAPTRACRIRWCRRSPCALKFELADKANAFLIGREALPLNDLSPDYPAMLVGQLHPRRFADVAAVGAAAAEGRPVVRRGQFLPAEFVRGQQPARRCTRSSRRRTSTRSARGFAEEMAQALKDGFTDGEVKNAKDGADAGAPPRRATRTASVAGALVEPGVPRPHVGHVAARSTPPSKS